MNQPEDTRQQMAVLSRSLKSYKRLRRNPNAAQTAAATVQFEDTAAPAPAAAAAGRTADHKKVYGVVRQDSTRQCGF